MEDFTPLRSRRGGSIGGMGLEVNTVPAINLRLGDGVFLWINNGSYLGFVEASSLSNQRCRGNQGQRQRLLDSLDTRRWLKERRSADGGRCDQNLLTIY